MGWSMNERMRTVIVDEVVAWGYKPDEYTTDRVAELFGKREKLYMIDLLTLPVPATDRAAMLFRTMSQKDLRLFAVWAARQVIELAGDGPTCGAGAVVDAAEAYAHGQIDRDDLTIAEAGLGDGCGIEVIAERWYEIARLVTVPDKRDWYDVAHGAASLYAAAYADSEVPAGMGTPPWERAYFVGWQNVASRLMDYCLKDRWDDEPTDSG